MSRGGLGTSVALGCALLAGSALAAPRALPAAPSASPSLSPSPGPQAPPFVVALEASSSMDDFLAYVRHELGSSVELLLPAKNAAQVLELCQARRASGIFLDREGNAVTTASFVLPGGSLTAVLPDGRRFRAEPVGIDPTSDLAVIRIAGAPAEPAPFLADRGPAPGEMLRLVSALRSTRCQNGQGRLVRASQHPGAGRLHDFLHLETPSASAGTAVLDPSGQVAGMVTASMAGGGTYAVPASTIARVSRELLDHGYVKRGWIGLTGFSGPGLERPPHGVRIHGTVPGSPAAVAGIAPGDIVLSYDGNRVDDTAELVRLVGDTPPGRTVRIAYLRNGHDAAALVRIDERPASEHGAVLVRLAEEQTYLGVEPQPLTPQLRERFRAPGEDGVLVSRVAAGSPAARSGLVPGDVIRRVGSRRMTSPADLVDLILAKSPGSSVTMEVWRDGAPLTINASVERRQVRTYISELPRLHVALDPHAWSALTCSVRALPPGDRIRGIAELRRLLASVSTALGPDERGRIERHLDVLARELTPAEPDPDK